MAKRLAIVGAGAKAAAIVARAKVLQELGVANVPDIVVFEADQIGSAWSGAGGFSSGYLRLCTPAEKDVGFPYQDVLHNGAPGTVASHLLARFSWPAYLVATGKYSEWIDRGRQHPTHSMWAKYLNWVFDQADHDVVLARVTRVCPRDGKWDVTVDGGSSTESFDGVVLTGTGRAKMIEVDPEVPADRVFNGETFWASRNAIFTGPEVSITVVGDGGAAGAIIAWLVERFAEQQRSIISVSTMGTLFPRGDGYTERRWFSDPFEWRKLSVEHRRKLVERTEGAVISERNKRAIDRSPNVLMHMGKADKAVWDLDEMAIENSYLGHKGAAVKTDYLVCAIGFEKWSILELVESDHATALVKGSTTFQAKVEEAITEDLALPALSGLPPGLHVPGLAGLARGPGMGNLGSLGLMAEAVLGPYLTKVSTR